jgi:hypothetical protein
MGNQTVRVNVAKNRLYIISDGFFTDDELDKGIDRVIREMAKVKPGFICISDVSTFKPATAAGAQKLQGLAAELVKKGVKKIIQIHAANDLTNMQVNRIAKNQIGDFVQHVGSMDEADKLADTF